MVSSRVFPEACILESQTCSSRADTWTAQHVADVEGEFHHNLIISQSKQGVLVGNMKIFGMCFCNEGSSNPLVCFYSFLSFRFLSLGRLWYLVKVKIDDLPILPGNGLWSRNWPLKCRHNTSPRQVFLWEGSRSLRPCCWELQRKHQCWCMSII